jgi:hypothetical protein
MHSMIPPLFHALLELYSHLFSGVALGTLPIGSTVPYLKPVLCWYLYLYLVNLRARALSIILSYHPNFVASITRHVLGKLGTMDNEKYGLTARMKRQVVRPMVEEVGCQAHRHSLQVRFFLCRRSGLSGP